MFTRGDDNRLYDNLALVSPHYKVDEPQHERRQKARVFLEKQTTREPDITLIHLFE